MSGFEVTRDAPDGAVHEWFGLSYANYLVLPRSLMQSMPLEWQERMCACLAEMESVFGDTFDPQDGDYYRVSVVSREGRYRLHTAPHYERGRTFVRRLSGGAM